MPISRLVSFISAIAVTLAGVAPVAAQQNMQITGTPDATTTIDGRYLPPPPQPFQGRIELNAAQ